MALRARGPIMALSEIRSSSSSSFRQWAAVATCRALPAPRGLVPAHRRGRISWRRLHRELLRQLKSTWSSWLATRAFQRVLVYGVPAAMIVFGAMQIDANEPGA